MKNSIEELRAKAEELTRKIEAEMDDVQTKTLEVWILEGEGSRKREQSKWRPGPQTEGLGVCRHRQAGPLKAWELPSCLLILKNCPAKF